MIYTTGTIAGNGSTITGTGTNFTAAGSLIRVGCTLIAFTNPVQVLQITAIASGTALSVTPAISPAIAAGTKYAILLSDSLSVDGLAQDIAETFGMYQKYMSGFADVMNGTGDVTITINGTPVTVPGQKSLAKKGANSDITSLSGLTTALSVGQGGHGGKNAADGLANLGGVPVSGATTLTGKKISRGAGSLVMQPMGDGAYTSAQIITESRGGVERIRFGGYWANTTDFTFNITMLDANGANEFRALGIYPDGTAYFSNNVSCKSLTQTSDRTLKDDVVEITDPLTKLSKLTGFTFSWKDNGGCSAGIMAQDLEEVLPGCVSDVDVFDGTEFVKKKAVDYNGVIALCVQAINVLSAKVAQLENEHKAE